MTDENTQKPAESSPSTMLGTIGIGSIVSIIVGLFTAAAGAGWPGVIALGAVGLGAGIFLPVGWNALVDFFNSKIDGRDNANAGTDAGKTAVDLANQGHDVSVGLDTAQKLDPPTDGLPPPSVKP